MTAKLSSSELNPEFQLLRAIGIVLVVLGHATDSFLWDPSFKAIKDLIYSFHMPLFFFISGFFGLKFFMPADRPLKPIIVNQFQRLMIVYCFCSALVIPMKLALNHYADRPLVAGNILRDLLLYPGHHPMIILWFIYVLFLMQMACLLIHSSVKINYRNSVDAATIFILLVMVHLASRNCTELLGLNRLAFFSIFFYLGFLASLHYEKLKSFLIRYRYGLIVLIPGFYGFYFQLRSILAAPFFFAVAGILFFWLVSVFLAEHRNFFRSSLIRIGNYSYEIYLYHYFFMAGLVVLLVKIPKSQTLLPFAPIFLFSLSCPMILSKYGLRKHVLLRRFALGDWSKPVHAD